jgi:hypothetical protein
MLKKISMIVGLALIAVAASLFMISEFASFFNTLAGKPPTDPIGYYTGSLVEVFLAIMIATKIPAKKYFHFANIVSGFLVIFLFLSTVAASSLNLISPLATKIQSNKNNQEIAGILKDDIKSTTNALLIFEGQKNNTAISVRSQRKSRKELRGTLAKRTNSFMLYLQLVLVLVVRVSIQSSNLMCVWLIGWVYRNVEIVKKSAREFLLAKGVKGTSDDGINKFCTFHNIQFVGELRKLLKKGDVDSLVEETTIHHSCYDAMSKMLKTI